MRLIGIYVAGPHIFVSHTSIWFRRYGKVPVWQPTSRMFLGRISVYQFVGFRRMSASRPKGRRVCTLSACRGNPYKFSFIDREAYFRFGRMPPRRLIGNPPTFGFSDGKTQLPPRNCFRVFCSCFLRTPWGSFGREVACSSPSFRFPRFSYDTWWELPNRLVSFLSFEFLGFSVSDFRGKFFSTWWSVFWVLIVRFRFSRRVLFDTPISFSESWLFAFPLSRFRWEISLRQGGQFSEFLSFGVSVFCDFLENFSRPVDRLGELLLI